MVGLEFREAITLQLLVCADIQIRAHEGTANTVHLSVAELELHGAQRSRILHPLRLCTPSRVKEVGRLAGTRASPRSIS
jgi:hypothetical protein